MHDLTEQFRLYRECVRVVWNVFVRTYPDADYDFAGIEAALFKAMVVADFESYYDPDIVDGNTLYRSLRIVPRSDRNRIDVLVDTASEGSRVWSKESWPAATEQIELAYNDLFDWEPFAGRFREFRYVRATVVRSNSCLFVVGQYVLIDADDVEVSDTSPKAMRSER